MLPILQIGPLAIPIPQFSILLAFWLGLSLSERYAPSRGLSAEKLYNLVFTGLAAGLIGARIGYIFQFPNAFVQSPQSLFSPNPGLLDTFSGLAYGLIGMLIYGQRVRLSIWNTLDALTPMLAVIAVGLAIAHIASGESFGSETSLPWGIYLWGAKRHPTQFYELITAATILGLITVRLRFINQAAGVLFLVFVTFTAAAHLFLETFHGDSSTIWNGIRIEQVFAWIILSGALLILDMINRKALLKG